MVLAKDQKKMILDTVSNFETFKKVRKGLGMDDIITYGVGMVMLFYGPPGTGKTMMANALANKLNKKVHILVCRCCIGTGYVVYLLLLFS